MILCVYTGKGHGDRYNTSEKPHSFCYIYDARYTTRTAVFFFVHVFTQDHQAEYVETLPD
jgi:hypothetical protein